MAKDFFSGIKCQELTPYGNEKLAINYKGANINVGFNPQYVLDVLQNLENDEVFLELSDEMSPGVFKINAPFLYVVMPVRLT